MADFKILDVFADNAWLVIRSEQYNADGSVWFVENYRWQGREGLKHKRKTNSDGRPLMDDGNIAPLRDVDITGVADPYLPEGRTCARHEVPHMDESSILRTIRSVHTQRLASGWEQGSIDAISPGKTPSQPDLDGVSVLVTHFESLKGNSYDC